jgi:hypothetical protein
LQEIKKYTEPVNVRKEELTEKIHAIVIMRILFFIPPFLALFWNISKKKIPIVPPLFFLPIK